MVKNMIIIEIAIIVVNNALEINLIIVLHVMLLLKEF